MKQIDVEHQLCYYVLNCNLNFTIFQLILESQAN